MYNESFSNISANKTKKSIKFRNLSPSNTLQQTNSQNFIFCLNQLVPCSDTVFHGLFNAMKLTNEMIILKIPYTIPQLITHVSNP